MPEMRYEELLKSWEATTAALWAVRVLDAWADMAPFKREWATRWSKARDCYVCSCAEVGGYGIDVPHASDATSRDAARLAAAEAVYPELPADVRQALGEKP